MNLNLHALLIDDDDDDRFLATAQLELTGYFTRVSEAGDGRTGLAKLGYGPPPPEALDPRPSIVFLDLSMPGMCGRQVLDRLDELSDIPPVVVLTSSRNPKDRVQCLRFGFVTSFEEKPLTAARARQLVEALP